MNFFIKIIVTIFLALPFSASFGAERDTSVVCKVIQHGLNDTWKLAASPLKWDATEWALAGGVGIATAALITWGDQPVYKFSNTLHSETLDVVALLSEPGGHIYPIAASCGMMIYGLLGKNNYALETALIAGESYLLTGFITQCVKSTTGRARPNNSGTTNPHHWEGPFFKGNSFFSGHTSTAFSVASVFAYRYRETTWVPVVSYTMATLCGLQRIYSNRHWASDVLLGAAVGTATGLFLCRQWENSSIRFYPVVTTEYSQFTLVIPIK
ncbi:MAG: phosphatase PAP2 family protein [Prolixibacteraceae bacterium]|nr:phosphatase PAP2 family protein [Prolixibacteraceae bacterium]